MASIVAGCSGCRRRGKARTQSAIALDRAMRALRSTRVTSLARPRVTSPPSPPARAAATRRRARPASRSACRRPAPRRTAAARRAHGSSRSMVQWKLCGLTTLTSTTLTARPSSRPSSAPARGPDGAFGGDDAEHLRARQARGAASRPNSLRRASTCAEKLAPMPNSPMRDRDRLQPVGHREAAVEDAQRRGADRAGRRELEQRAVEAELAGERAQRCADGVDLGAGAQPQRDVVDAQVAGQALVVGAGERDRRHAGARSRARRRARGPARASRPAAAGPAARPARRRTGRPSPR